MMDGTDQVDEATYRQLCTAEDTETLKSTYQRLSSDLRRTMKEHGFKHPAFDSTVEKMCAVEEELRAREVDVDALVD